MGTRKPVWKRPLALGWCFLPVVSIELVDIRVKVTLVAHALTIKFTLKMSDCVV